MPAVAQSSALHVACRARPCSLPPCPGCSHHDKREDVGAQHIVFPEMDSTAGRELREPPHPWKAQSWPVSCSSTGKSLPAGSPDASSFGWIEAFQK